jgi:hypothetical protein
MVNYPFSINEWMPRFPLSRHLKSDDDDDVPRISAPAVTSPSHICDLEQLRVALHDQFDWGPAVPVDIFIMGEGEPPDRHVTKIGGIPYWPASQAWPIGNSGRPLQFLGQICFADSKDLTGPLPGDVLLLFSEDAEDPGPIHFEWQALGLTEVLGPGEAPDSASPFAPCHGFIYRTTSYPKARRLAASKQAEYPTWKGAEVWQEFFVPCVSATQIGEAPFYINDNPRPARALCALNTVSPEPVGPFPWVNRPEPLFRSVDEWLDQPKEDETRWFTFGDTGCVYVFIDDRGQLHSDLDSF